MGEYTATTEVTAGASALFDYLSEVGNLPKYFNRMTSAEPAEGEAVHVTASVEGREVEGEAWFRVDEHARTIAWGSEGPNDYHGELTVSGTDDTSSVTARISTERADGSQVEDGLHETLANIKHIVEGG